MSAGISLSTIGSVIGIASGIKGLTSKGGGGTVSPAAQQAADPFSAYRGRLAQLYAGALEPTSQTDPTKMPGYSMWKTGVLDPAMQAVTKQAAASGRAYSGAEAMGLTDVAGRGYYGFMTDYLNRLAQGSGAVQNPAQAAGLGINAAQDQWKSIGQGIGGLQNYFGSGAESVGYSPYGASTVPGVVPGGYMYGGETVNNPSAYTGTYIPPSSGFDPSVFGGDYYG